MSDAAATPAAPAPTPEPTAAPDASAEPDTAAPDAPEASAPPSNGTEAEAVAAATAAKWKLKIDGEEQELPQDEVLKLAQKAKAADKRFDEAHKLKQSLEQERQTFQQQIQQVQSTAQRDPIGFLAKLLGGDRDAVYDAVYQELRYDSLPAEEKQRIQQEHQLRSKAARADEYEKQERDRAAAAETDKLEQQYATEMRASLTAAGLNADDPDTVERWLMQRMSAMDQGVEMSAEEAAQRVAESRKRSIEQLAALEGEALLKELPEAVVQKIRAADAARLTAKQQQRQRTPAGQFAPGKQPPNGKPKREVSPEKWLRTMRQHGIDAANKLFDE